MPANLQTQCRTSISMMNAKRRRIHFFKVMAPETSVVKCINRIECAKLQTNDIKQYYTFIAMNKMFTDCNCF